MGELHSRRINDGNRDVLKPRRPGIEKLITSMPFEPVNRNDLRGWTLALTASASAWEVRQVKAGLSRRNRALNKHEATQLLGMALAKLAKDGAE